MTAQTYADAAGAMRAWINGRTELVGLSKPLASGAHLKRLDSPAQQTYAFLEETLTFASTEENPDMVATLSAQVYGGTREAASTAALALAEELTTGLCGCAVTTVPGVLLWVADDVQGPTWSPDREVPRYLLNFTVRLRPM